MEAEPPPPLLLLMVPCCAHNSSSLISTGRALRGATFTDCIHGTGCGTRGVCLVDAGRSLAMVSLRCIAVIEGFAVPTGVAVTALA